QRGQALLVGRLFGSPSLGHYSQAQSLQASASALLGSILARVGLPALAELQVDTAAFAKRFLAALRIGMLVNIPIVVLVSMLAKDLVLLLLGGQWEYAANLLSVLALSGALWPMQVVNLTALNALGRSDLFFRAEIAKKLVGILA